MHEHPKKIQAMQGSCKDYVPGLGPLPRRLLDQYAHFCSLSRHDSILQSRK